MNFTEIVNLFQQQKASAKSHIKNLIEIALVDEEFSEAELIILKQIAKRNNISENQLEEIRQNPHTIAFEVPENEQEKFYQFYDLVHMMCSDKSIKSIQEKEVELCNLYAIKFGYPSEAIKDMIETIRLNIAHGNGHAETMKRVAYTPGLNSKSI